MGMRLGQRAYTLLPAVAQRRLADVAISSAIGRDRLGMLLRALEALGCDRFALADLLRRLHRLDDFPPTAAAEAERWAERARRALDSGHMESARAHLLQATLFFALADWLASGEVKRANFARLVW